MNSNVILSSDVLDILFDKRNKSYGAYTLRKFYPGRIKTSLLIMLGLSAVFSAFTFLPERKIVYDYPGAITDPLVTSVLEIKDEIEKPKQQTIPPAQKVPTQQFTDNFRIVKDNKPSTSFNNIENMNVGTVTDTAGMSIIPETPFISEGPVATVGSPASPAERDINIPVDNPDVPPSYPGGIQALRHFLERNLQSPEDIAEAVQVKVKFVVDNDGNLESFDIIQDGGEDFNREVIRVLKKMPQWNPGKKGGRSVKAYCYLPVKFAPME